METSGYDFIGDKNFDHDSFWKSLISRFCYPLLKRAVPELYEKADITKAYRPLDKEFMDLLNTGKRDLHNNPYFADMLLEIPLKNGAVEWVIFHCEAQGRGGGSISERMFHYMCLIYAHYRRNPVALAIITDGHKKDKRIFSHSHFGTESVYRYNNLVLADIDDTELQASDNPIDLAVYAAKCALHAKEELQKFNYLRSLLNLLGERGWGKDDKRDLLLFLERIMDLRDKELEKKYVEYREELSKEGKIMYIPLGERELAREIEQRGIKEGMVKGIKEGIVKGIKEGMVKGMEKGKEEMVRNFLADGYPPEAVAKSAGWPVEQVRKLIN